MNNFRTVPRRLFHFVYTLGVMAEMDEYQKRKTGIFNLLNAFGLITGIILPIAGIFSKDHLPLLAWVVAASPAFISLLVLLGNYYRRYELARLGYFILYPLLSSLVYAGGMELGIELFFILYAVLSVFFLEKFINILLAFSLSMSLYLVFYLNKSSFFYLLQNENTLFYYFNHVLAIFFIFYSLFLVKKENRNYQLSIVEKNEALSKANVLLAAQRADIEEKALVLEEQKLELDELNAIKTRLLSIISHDLRTPLYALRNLFEGAIRYDMDAAELKSMVPDVCNDLNYSIGLLENLLLWSKNQMNQADPAREKVDITAIIKKITGLYRLHAASKGLKVEAETEEPVYIMADKDMLEAVLRNLISNAIKFTAPQGAVRISLDACHAHARIAVQDTGIGMNADELEKINQNQFYSRPGTAHESGSGLGLQLCREFLGRHGEALQIDSEPGNGTIFSFQLPLAV